MGLEPMNLRLERIRPLHVAAYIEQLTTMDSGKGHIGLVHQALDGFLYTIEGNRSPMVQGFTYVLGRMDKLLGFGRVPD